MRLYLLMNPSEQGSDRNLMRPDAGILTGGRAGGAGVGVREARCRRFFVVKPKAAQDPGRVERSAGSRTGRIFTKRAPKQLRTGDVFLKQLYLSCYSSGISTYVASPMPPQLMVFTSGRPYPYPR